VDTVAGVPRQCRGQTRFTRGRGRASHCRITHWFAGEFAEARRHFERALALFQAGRDDDLAFRFGLDPGVGALTHLASASWLLGEVDHAIGLAKHAEARVAEVTDIGSVGDGQAHLAVSDMMRRNVARAAPRIAELARVAKPHDLALWGAVGVFCKAG
jgi:hypothetical protein